MLRQYGAEKLTETGETECIGQQHFNYYFQAVRQNQPGLQIATALQAFHWLVREHLNLQAALEWASACGEEANAQELARLMHADFPRYTPLPVQLLPLAHGRRRAQVVDWMGEALNRLLLS